MYNTNCEHANLEKGFIRKQYSIAIFLFQFFSSQKKKLSNVTI